jgi:hypothetical protein
MDSELAAALEAAKAAGCHQLRNGGLGGYGPAAERAIRQYARAYCATPLRLPATSTTNVNTPPVSAPKHARSREQRPAARSSSTRRSGSSRASPDDPELPWPRRHCRRCGCDIEHRRSQALTCGRKCRVEKHRKGSRFLEDGRDPPGLSETDLAERLNRNPQLHRKGFRITPDKVADLLAPLVTAGLVPLLPGGRWGGSADPAVRAAWRDS